MRHLDLFSGIGGGAIAVDAVWPGSEHIFCENDEFCQSILKKNYPNAEIHGDIKKFSGGGLKGIDIITGGFPCQDISNARTWTTQDRFIRQGIDGERSGLWSEMCRIISETRPKFVVAENVEALVKKGLRNVLRNLYAVGYDAEWDIVSAAYVGAPHQRKRLWIVAYPISFGWEQAGIIFCKITRQKVRYSPQWESSRTVCEKTGKRTLPEFTRVYDGVSEKLDNANRVKGLGNAWVPQVAIEIMKAIKETHEPQ